MLILKHQKEEKDAQENKQTTLHNIDNQAVAVVWHLLK
jgi:hypothetical protein